MNIKSGFNNKAIFTLAFLMVSAFNVSAQISLGAKLGASVYDNYQMGSAYYVSEPKPGFLGGIYGEYQLGDKLAIRQEIISANRGISVTTPLSGGEYVEHNRESWYLDLPFSASYNIWRNLRIHAGIMPSLFIDEYRSLSKTGDDFLVDSDDEVQSHERWQLGAIAGATYIVPVFNKELELGVRYAMGLTDTYETIREVRADRDLRYMTIQLHIAYNVFSF